MNQTAAALATDARTEIVNALNQSVAETVVTTMLAQNFHWNVTGPMFNTLHLMFMDQYTELWNSVDVIAERIRALDQFAIGSYKDFSHYSSVKDAPSNPPKAEEMIALLVEGHETVIKTIRSIYELVGKASDQATEDMLTQRINVHEKTAWMLRSLLEK